MWRVRSASWPRSAGRAAGYEQVRAPYRVRGASRSHHVRWGVVSCIRGSTWIRGDYIVWAVLPVVPAWGGLHGARRVRHVLGARCYAAVHAAGNRLYWVLLGWGGQSGIVRVVRCGLTARRAASCQVRSVQRRPPSRCYVVASATGSRLCRGLLGRGGQCICCRRWHGVDGAQCIHHACCIALPRVGGSARRGMGHVA